MSKRLLVITGLVVWGVALVAAVVSGRGVVMPAPSTNAFQAVAPAASVTRLEIVGGDANVTIAASASDQIELAVDLASSPPIGVFVGRRVGDAAETWLDSSMQGTMMTAHLRGAIGDGLTERWTVRVPARLAADVSIHRGHIDITGLEGGVRARADSGIGHESGAIRVDVPRGSLDLSLGVGTIDARAGETPRGGIDVRSRVGRASLSVDGHNIVAGHEPGPGERVRLTGDGPDDIVVRVGVGDAHVRVR
jgi:hypothetical protein